VNHGLFHYYFKTKERFYAEVIRHLFEDFTENTLESPVEYKSPVERLRALVINFAFFVRDNWKLMWPIVKDVEVNKIVRVNFSGHFIPHINVLREALRECRLDGCLIDEKDEFLLDHLLNISVGPIIMNQMMEEIIPNGPKRHSFLSGNEGIDTKAIYRRVEVAFRYILKPQHQGQKRELTPRRQVGES